ncbi:pyridoxamine 5'-phosphate oxidase family protein [Aureimonas frigidaquae]|uniref:Pyridoxamine 5'-phosphate oxidase family protein n=1 Tax=Aureimonas frigidaquae TaxID=424757 RepID=A0A0P0Z2C5_9HYPH|nr:pyridoxamine 5'-phosphate oxidase family protein [Aureimonas frigidaquae]BAT28079.1 pyridoxamine 5'-phosphate oxidase family protein [Aureimonas frigidaquae]
MTTGGDSACIDTADALEALYGPVAPTSILKEVDHIHPLYRPFIEAAPFAVLATAGPNGLDASPRGDPAGFVTIEDDRTLVLPDRRGNNRIDSLRNIIADPRVALLFLIPGIGETLRVNGTGRIHAGPDDLARYEVDGRVPKTLLRIHVTSVFFQCSRAIIRSGLWTQAAHVTHDRLPSPGTILRAVSDQSFDGEAYDAALPRRLADTLY